MKSLGKNILREIKNTKSRFISILAIIGLSTGFFCGIKASCPSMLKTGFDYFEEKNLMDIRLVSTVGFDDDDVKSIREQKCTVDVMPGYSADLIVSEKNIDTVVKVISVPEKHSDDDIINKLVVTEGRLPNKEGECVIESYAYSLGIHKIGDVIKFNEKIQDRKTTDVIKNLNYKIVGAVSTPTYITYQRGSSSVGDGGVSYFVMIPFSDFAYERYTDVYVTTTSSRNGLKPFTDDYKKSIEQDSAVFEALSEDRIRNFNNTTLKDAKTKLSDAQKEFSEKKDESEKKLTDGEKQLHDGEKELAEKLIESEEKLDAAEKEIEDGKKELEEGQKKYSEGILDAKNKLTDAQTQYNEGKAAYYSAKLEYDMEIEKAQTQFDNAETEYNTQYSLFYGTTKPQAETKLTLLKSGIDLCNEAIKKTESRIDELEKIITPDGEMKTELDQLKSKLKEYKDKIAGYNKQYEDGTKKLSEGEEKLLAAKQKLEDAKAQFYEKKSEGSVKLNDAQIKLEDAQSKLDIGKLEYETAMTTGIFELQQAQTKISDGEKQLEKGRQTLTEQKNAGMLRLKESREKLAAGKAEAHKQLGDAEKKINDAKKSIDSLENAKWYVFDRDDNPGYSGLEEDAQRVDKIADVFPFFFMIVAALVCLTTMSRMVEERRTEIGTLKALGYSNSSIALKYFVYSAAASITGSLIGFLLGIFTLPYIIVDTYSIMYTLPATRLVIPWGAFLFSAGIGLLCTTLVAVVACFNELRIKPATLMRPKAPKPGKRILLEHIPFIWKNMNFISKVTARNLFRYKARFLMTVIGIAGCTALILGGLGLKDSISVIADRQYKEISVYDEIYALSESGTIKQKEYLMSQFHDDDRFSEILLVSQNWATSHYKHIDKKIDYRYIVPSDMAEFKKMFTLRNRLSHEKVKLSDDGVVINERLSQVLELNTGDTISFTIEERPYSARITGITENYAGNMMYMTPKFFEKLTDKETKYNLVYTQVTDEAREYEREIANEWMKKDEIMTVSMLNEQLESILSTLDSLNVIVVVLVICAGLLAIVVLYNLTNINISERVREIATIKVLGFYDMETANYIYRENIILTVTGALVGIPLGRVFISFIVESIQMDMVMFPQQINLLSYISGFMLTISFSLIVNFIMYFKMKKVSMAESLKSIE